MAESPIRLLILLQNAYDKGDLALGWHPRRWRLELESSLTGRRLMKALPQEPGWEFRFANACPGIGQGSASRLKPCSRHVRRAIRRVQPDAILACGRIAEEVITPVWSSSLFAIPHPASRVLTNALLQRCRCELRVWALQPELKRWALRNDRKRRRGLLEVLPGAIALPAGDM